jgi:hypothetical protein
VDIQIEQDGAELQVAPGATLPVAFTVAPSQKGYVADLPPTDPGYPAMWYQDVNTGLWKLEDTASSGAIAYERTSGTIRYGLPHLSGWNVDGIQTPNGCVQGRIVDTLGNPVTSKEARLWLLGVAAHVVADFPLSPAADGSFCKNVSGVKVGAFEAGEGLDASAPYFVSLGDPSQTTCNPLPFSSLSACTGEPDYCFQDMGVPIIPTGNGCNLPETKIAVCHCCPDDPFATCYTAAAGFSVPSKAVVGGCVDLGTVVLPPNGTNICANPALAKKIGDACQVDEECCPSGSLACRDGLCVPLGQ